MSFRYSPWRSGRGLALRLVLLTGLLLFVSGAGGAIQTSGADRFDTGPEPAVFDRDDIALNASLRIVAAGDRDPINTSSNVTQLATINGSLKLITNRTSPSGIALNQEAYTNARSARMAPEIDGYRTNLYSDFYIPYQEQWIPVSDSRVTKTDVLPSAFYNTSNDSSSGVRASVNPQGEWYGVRNASVNKTADGGEITNPGEAVVNGGKHISMEDRERVAIEQISTAKLQSNTTSGADNMTIPIVNYRADEGGGTKRFPTEVSSQSSISYRWKGDSVRPIDGHWAWLQSVTPGAWSSRANAFVLPANGSTARALADFNASLGISGYSETDYCTENWDTDEVEYWETFAFDRYELENNVTLGSKTVTDGPQESAPDREVRLPSSSPGSRQIQFTSTVKLYYTHNFGVNHGCDPSWSKTETQVAEHTITRSYPAEVVSPDFEMTIYTLDKPQSNKIYIESAPPTFSLSDYPLHTLELQTNGVDSNGRSFVIQSPWRFYRLRAYDRLRLANWTTVEPTLTNNTFRRYLWRDYADAGQYRTLNNTMGYSTLDRRTGGVVPALDRNISQNSYDPRHPMATARFNSTANMDEGAEMYETIGGAVSGPTDAALENLTANATDVFGQSTSPTVVHREYQESTLMLRNDGAKIRARLHHNGSGIDGKQLNLTGAAVDSVTTNGSGWATFQANASMVHAKFDGSPYDQPRSDYYTQASASVIIPSLIFNDPINVWSRIGRAMSSLMLIAEWIVLGLFCLYMYRRKKRFLGA